MKNKIFQFLIITIASVFIISSIVLMIINFKTANFLLVIINWIPGILGLLIFLLNYLYSKITYFNLFIQRIKNNIFNTTEIWNISLEFLKIKDSIKTIEKLEDKIIKKYPNSKIEKISKVSELISIEDSGINLKLILDNYNGNNSLYIKFNNITCSYRNALNKLENEIIPILDLIDKISNPENTKISFSIKFEKNNNPFFGLFIQKINPLSIRDFHLSFIINEPNSIVVTKSEISFTFSSIHSLLKNARDIFSLSPRILPGV